MRATTSRQSGYEEWKRQALARDVRHGLERWKADDRSVDYDYQIIARRWSEIAELRRTGNLRQLIYYFNEGIHGNMGGMGSPRLYQHANFGTKDLINRYVAEVIGALEDLAAAPERSFGAESKADFFRRLKHGYGRSALMLSGAGSLGPFHLGVAKALWEQGLLPNVISGASAGSIVAAILCTHQNDDLQRLLAYDRLLETFRELTNDQSGVRRKQVGINDLRAIIETWIPDVTFAEALAISGRNLNVSVSPSELHQQSRTLNAVIAPDVLVREAVLASSAIPGLFSPVRLTARGIEGEIQPYVASRRWVDGSVTDDMPVRRLARIYGCNFFIASQINPFVLWSLTDPNSRNPYYQLMNNFRSAYQQLYRNSYPYAMQMVRNVYPWNVMTRFWYGIATQDYTADVNIMPSQRFRDPTKLLAVLSSREAQALVHEGERAAWPKLERIRICTSLGHCMRRILRELEPDRVSNEIAA